ncbi:hypothetical protein ACJRO7_006561 [Eucalyptus globulus]|uniref:Secreted protein n=1 Tax=Eucalyptus globulus TaxID=34317 RepID=A0ABD3IJR6_EUCGL
MATIPRMKKLVALVSLVLLSYSCAEATDSGSAGVADGAVRQCSGDRLCEASASSPTPSGQVGGNSAVDDGTDTTNQDDGSAGDAEVIKAAPTTAPTTDQTEVPTIESELIVLGH